MLHKPMPFRYQRLFLFLAYAIPFVLIIGRAPADILLGLVVLGFLGHSVMARDFSWLKKGWVKLAGVTWLYLILSGLLAKYDVGAGVGRGLPWVRFPLFAVAFGHWLLPMDRDFHLLRRMLVVLLPLVIVDTLFQFITGTSLTGYPRGSYMGRLTGPFGKEEMVVGTYLSRLAWPAIGLVFSWAIAQIDTERLKTRLWLLLPLGLAAVLGITILVTGERMAALLFLFSAGLFWLGARGCRRMGLIVGGMFATIALLVVLARPDLYHRLVTATVPILEDFDKSSYGAIVDNALMTWRTSPVIGVGPKNFLAACQANGAAGGFRDEAVKGPVFSCARHPHNPYLEWLTETGVIGLGLFAGLIGMWSMIVRRNLCRADDARYYAALGFGVGLVPFLWPLMASTSFFINWSAILFWWVLGLSLVEREDPSK